ncbi:TRAP transporter large permease [Rhizobium oryzihabitans]|jgi:tripartite ATP-independent transporter DctM subunit|uniref:TRAP transporter large permease protein n=1 Tax=Rhizobium oryzihabitans TaxID=2267833 RepID=A0A7L5BLF4_9HYPH|nr:TRAP transporter large permease [Rhizobium oryzihabitans]EGP54979.1 ABC transporter, membrane spanning protein [Agrobacterium tumefaciens F2]QCM06689.1 TRAP transporter large permease [Agrobacterium tumefaciens]CUX50040.1 putative TRAP-type C4-dicarboxylate transport system, large permease component (dctM subunit) [Agrobacterium genomosp. 5 str. CFBP 6626]QIB39714.1 TRAP transporter large permease [Rhizobium oryzihabitans]WKL23257.1 TRAP transporter large permease [Agrobacterium tumefaciens
MAYTILFGVFTLLMLIGTPIAFCLGIASFFTVLYLGLPPIVVFQQMNSGMNVFAMMAIPFFIFAGDLMVRGGIAHRLIRFAAGLVGHLRGGLGQVNIVASTLFGGISGSAVADASAVGGLMIPQMAKRGYDRDYAVNVTVNAAIIALMIPPSHNMILYSIAAGGNVSVADLFTAGIIPGFLLAAALMVTAYIVARRKGYPSEPFPGFSKLMYYLLASFPGILLIGIIFGGVRSGIFTATESSCIAVLYAFLVAMLVYRELNWSGFVEAVMGAVRTTAMVLLVIGTAAAFGWLMAFLQVQTLMIAAISAISDNPIIVLLVINVILLLLGTFMDMAPMVIISTPVLLPVVKAFGIDPVHFGVVMILNAGIGLNTPPVGTVLFVGCAVGGISIREAMRTIWPFFGASIAVLLAVTYIPSLSLWLPSLFR